MKKFSKLLLAGILACSVTSAALVGISTLKNNEAPIAAKADDDLLPAETVTLFKIDGQTFKNPGLTKRTGNGWNYNPGQYGHILLNLENYHGGAIKFICLYQVEIYIRGENVIEVEDDTSNGLSIQGGPLRLNYASADASLTINSAATCITISNSERNRLETLTLGKSTNCKLVLNSSAGSGLAAEQANISGDLSIIARTYLNSFEMPIEDTMMHILPKDLPGADEINIKWYFLTNAEVGVKCTHIDLDENASIAAISETGRAISNIYYSDFRALLDSGATVGTLSFSWVHGIGRHRQYMIPDYDLSHFFISPDEKIICASYDSSKVYRGLLEFADESPVKGQPGVDTKYQLAKDEQATFSFNNSNLPQTLTDSGYSVVKGYDFRVKGSSTAIATVENNADNSPLTYTYSFNELERYYFTSKLSLKKGDAICGSVQHRFEVIPYTHHEISEDMNAYSLRDVNKTRESIITGDTYQFRIDVQPYYHSNGNELFFANDEEITPDNNGIYTLEDIHEDIVISVLSSTAAKYYSNVRFIVNDQEFSAAYVEKGMTLTFPTIPENLIPEGKTYKWKIETRTTLYEAGQQTTLREEERGVLRVTAHFEGLYNLSIVDGHFYSDEACTQIITQAPQVPVGSRKYTYFKFNQTIDEVVDGRLLYGYKMVEGTVQIYEYDDGIWFFEMTAADVVIEPIYKYVIDELVIQDINVPISGKPLHEFREHAPEEENYKINSHSQLWYKVEGSNRSLVHTFDEQNPYTFKNDTTYELDVTFSAKEGYILNQNGFNRDGQYQLEIEGLDESNYEITDARFTNNLDKSYYVFTIRMQSINEHEVIVTDGKAFLGDLEITSANVGDEVLLSANKAPSGQVFDKWELTGITVDEELIINSKLSIVMPNNEVSATATYKVAEYFDVVFLANGGSGVMEDGKAYDNTFILPENGFIAPEHKHFKAWEIDGVEYREGETIAVDANIEVKALWELDVHVVTFDANGGSGTMESIEVNYGEEFVLPSCDFVAPEGKEFKCWAIGDEEITTNAITIEGDVTLRAVWKDADHPGDDSSSSESSEPVTPDTPKKKGCGGSLLAASIAIPTLLGLSTLVLIKKRKEK